MSFWPTPEWAPWAALTAAGVRATDDVRNVGEPCVLFEIQSEAIETVCVTSVTVKATAVVKPPDNADSRKWLWLTAVPVLLRFADESGAYSTEWNGSPAVELTIPVSHTEV